MVTVRRISTGEIVTDAVFEDKGDILAGPLGNEVFTSVLRVDGKEIHSCLKRSIVPKNEDAYIFRYAHNKKVFFEAGYIVEA